MKTLGHGCFGGWLGVSDIHRDGGHAVDLFLGICRLGLAIFGEQSRNSPGKGSFDLPGRVLVLRLVDS